MIPEIFPQCSDSGMVLVILWFWGQIPRYEFWSTLSEKSVQEGILALGLRWKVKDKKLNRKATIIKLMLLGNRKNIYTAKYEWSINKVLRPS